MEHNFTALDTETLQEVGLVHPEETETEIENDSATTDTEETKVETGNEIVESEEVTNTESDDEKKTTDEVTTFNIEGIGEVKLDEIKEWYKGHLRQSDYTKKTQELARQREEVQEAVELFEYLQQNPHLVQQLQKLDESGSANDEVLQKTTPYNAMLKQLWYNQKSMEIDRQLDNLKAKYGDIDEVALFDTARELKTDNLEMAYRVIAFDSKPPLDEKALIEKAKNELRMELEKNKQSTKTIVSPTSQVVKQAADNLTDEEKRVARMMGLSESDYAKWKNK